MAGVEIQSLRLIEKDNSRRRRHHDIEEEKEKIFISGLDSYNRHHHTGSSSSQTHLAGDDPLIEELPPYRRRNVGKSLTAYGKPLRLRGLTERVVSSSSSKKRDKEDSGHCSSSSSSEAGEDCRNLSICFLNETASEDEDEEEEDQKSEEHYNSLKIERVSAKSLKRDFLNSSSSSLSSSSHSPLPSPTKSPSSFPQQIKAIQDEAKRKLEVAKYIAAKTIANDRTQRRLNSPTCRILGLQYSKKLNRTILTDMNVAQLQIILNSFLSTIEGLNEDLVQFLILRDELAIEQDSLLTDIEDITQSLRSDPTYIFKNTMTLESLLEEIAFRRRKDIRSSPTDRIGFSTSYSTTYWTDLFVRHFLFQTEIEVDQDDMLFFVRKLPRSRNVLEVFRRDSRKLPIGDPDIDWEKTIYLNLIVHQLDYTITLAICSRTSPKDLQVLKRYSQKVYATPSRRKMDGKGDFEEITYPNVCFTVDNFDEIFGETVIRDGESLGIELTATDPTNLIKTVLFTASVPYEPIRRVYDSHVQETCGVCVRIIGISDQGHAELGVSKTKEGCETPCSEPGMGSLRNGLLLQRSKSPPPTSSALKKTHHRRLSDPSSSINDFMRMGILSDTRYHHRSNNLHPNTVGGHRSSSESDGLDLLCGDAHCEIYAGDLLDEFEETKYNPLWTMKGHTQIFHSWRETKRFQCIPFSTYVTYVTLPWWTIITNILNKQKPPLLTFD
ncbi:unnamed protein product [Lepeophtheirus salmonis]|uniref:(salmon louse) hypothetical protein n=1 Tax=Lepeophtheirus salmonis TaxID=72036 RepID=A0A7R8CUX1_LEPSM|nr:unnamed protein product [Lepeophtheirus salmonis]CAF2902833.1 unnamed protein product [Lepeophtheirus salmonis]